MFQLQYTTKDKCLAQILKKKIFFTEFSIGINKESKFKFCELIAKKAEFCCYLLHEDYLN